jgi:hypothetical protein
MFEASKTFEFLIFYFGINVGEGSPKVHKADFASITIFNGTRRC